MDTTEQIGLLLHYEDLQHLLELTPQNNVLFIIGDWSAKVDSQEMPGITGKFSLGVENEARENTLVTANTLFQSPKTTLDMGISRWSIWK